MKRLLSAIAVTAVAAGVTLIAAPAANAVTNPADNPRKVTVQGSDGNTYIDGQDTLPGYDDYDCTYIPGAWFDFEKNRVYYADGSWIPWTEWERATGYKEWLAKKKETKSDGGTKSGTKKTDKKKSSTKSGSKTSTKTETKTTSGTKTETKTTSGTKTDSAKAEGPTAGETTVDETEAPSIDASVEPTPDVSFSPAEVGDVDYASDETSPDAVVADGETPAAPGSGAGLLILGGLAAAGALSYGGYTLAKGGRRKGTAS